MFCITACGSQTFKERRDANPDIPGATTALEIRKTEEFEVFNV
jgi:hypothetical protein